jgi:hypothetical protein
LKKLKKFLLVLLAVFSQLLYSQQKNGSEYSGFFDSYYFRGPVNFIAGGGATGYSGDLKKGKPSYIFGLGASYKLWPRTYFGAQLNFLNLQGKDADTIRNISFNNNMKELYMYCRFNILDRKMLKNMDVKRMEMFFRPYVTLGVGVNRYNVTSSTTNPDWDKNSIPENVSYPRTGFFIPAGVGVAFRITHRISILTEFNYRFPFTDYLDDVSARGNTKKDVYYTGELKVQYTPFAPKRKKKHKFTEPAQGSGGGGTAAPKPAIVEPKPAQDNLTPTEEPVVKPLEEPAPEPIPVEEPKKDDNSGWPSEEPTPNNKKPK